jgi:hypothetical protein
VHPSECSASDEEIDPVVELFQSSGNTEYWRAPGENNLTRPQTTHSNKAFVDYALREKGIKMGFITSGDYN